MIMVKGLTVHWWRAVIGVMVAGALMIAGCSGTGPPGHQRAQGPAAAGRTHEPPAAPGPARGGRVLMPAVTPACRPGVNAAEFWMISRRELGVMSAVAPAELRYAVKPANLFVPDGPAATARTGQTVADFRSYAGLTAAIAAHRIPPGVHWVMYDNERWPATPVAEQHSPAHYEALFARLAHQHGYRVILAPGQDLALGFGTSRLPRGKPAWRRYLAMRLPAASARAADIYEIQAQAYELPQFRSQDLYLRVIKASIAQARAASPGITIFAGLSTNRVVSTADMRHDYLTARGLVAGFWLNIPHYQERRQRQIAREFMGRLPPAAAASGRPCARTVPPHPPSPAPPSVLGGRGNRLGPR
jgi:hypothetical protein